MWYHITSGNEFLQRTFSPARRVPRSQTHSINGGHGQEVANAQNRVKNYDKYLLEIRKKKHLERVSKTKFVKKFIKHQGPLEAGKNFTFGVADPAPAVQRKESSNLDSIGIVSAAAYSPAFTNPVTNEKDK